MIQQESKAFSRKTTLNKNAKPRNKFRVVLRTVSRSLAIIALFLLTPLFVQGAILYFESDVSEVAIGQQFQVDVILNTEGEQINAVEGKIVFPDELLEVKEIRDGDSIINFWIERPDVPLKDTNTNTNKHELSFSGITPGGYIGSQGLILSTIFQAKKEGGGAIEIRDAKVLLNDGEGTPASVKLSPFQFSISQEAPAAPPMVETVKDADLPEDFKPEIAQSPEIFDGKYFLVFATQDKGSGIAGYAVHESTQKKDATRINTKKWQEAESPYVLKDQKLRSWIYVKAIDKAGNERIVMLPPKYPLKWYEKWENWIIIILGLAIAYAIKKFLWRIIIHQ